MDTSFFKKRFSIGLVLNDSLDDYTNFLTQYADFIDTIYFSLPLGDRFHGRPQVAQQFKNPVIVSKFWEILRLISDFGIKLEPVFNTNHLNADDLYQAAELLGKQNIEIDKLAITDDLYEAAVIYFPQKGLIYSISNYGTIIKKLESNPHKYNEIVIGRNCIRDVGAYEIVRKRNEDVLLVLNDGCSFMCEGLCSEHGSNASSYCEQNFKKAVEKSNVEYVYALQSIMPFEIHEQLLPLDSIRYFKLSTRNSELAYIRKCLDSYIYNIQEVDRTGDGSEYFLWARLTWFSPYYQSMDAERIISLKRKLYIGGSK